MLKKFIAYQKLLLNSTPSINITSKSLSKTLLFFAAISVMVFMNMFIFMGTVLNANTTLIIILPVASIWMINRILYGDTRLFDTVPVSKKYTVLNIFILSIVISTMGYLIFSLSIAALIWILVVIVYIISPQSMTTPASDAQSIIDTTKGDILILFIFVIILFGGIAITFIKNKKLRLSSFVLFSTIGYGLLFFLKLYLPITSSTKRIEFLESFSIMPWSNTILLCVGISAVIISITSVFIGYNLYVGKSAATNKRLK